MTHAEIGGLLGKNDVACRQLLSRARENVASERRVFRTPRDQHRRLLLSFVNSVTNGDRTQLEAILAEDADLIADAGDQGARFGRIRNVGRPVVGGTRIAAFLAQFIRQDVPDLEIQERILNGEPAVVILQRGRPFAAIFVAAADHKIRHVFVQIDPRRLALLGSAN